MKLLVGARIARSLILNPARLLLAILLSVNNVDASSSQAAPTRSTTRSAALPTSPPSSRRSMVVPHGGGGGATLPTSSTTIPSLFADDEQIYDTYAACLAATEGLRRLRDRQMAASSSPANSNHSRAVAQRQYARNSARVVQALGLSVADYNAIGARLVQGEDDALKEKIVQQACLYRAATAVTLDRFPVVLATEQQEKKNLGPVSQSKLQSFCESVLQVESLRRVQAERLLALSRDGDDAEFSSGADLLPAHLSDPALLPLLTPRARKLVESFPEEAADLVQQHGLLDCDEFNRLLAASRSNPLFRWRVRRQIKKQLRRQQ